MNIHPNNARKFSTTLKYKKLQNRKYRNNSFLNNFHFFLVFGLPKWNKNLTKFTSISRKMKMHINKNCL